MLRIFHVSTLYHRISFANVRHCIVGALRRRYFPFGEITGRLIAVILWCDRPRRSLDFDSLRGAPPYADGATEFPGRKFRCAGRAKPAPWLSHRESWHGAAVTERVPCSNQRTFSKLATAYALSGSLIARQLPHRGSQGRLRRRICTVLPSAPIDVHCHFAAPPDLFFFYPTSGSRTSRGVNMGWPKCLTKRWHLMRKA